MFQLEDGHLAGEDCGVMFLIYLSPSLVWAHKQGCLYWLNEQHPPSNFSTCLNHLEVSCSWLKLDHQALILSFSPNCRSVFCSSWPLCDHFLLWVHRPVPCPVSIFLCSYNDYCLSVLESSWTTCRLVTVGSVHVTSKKDRSQSPHCEYNCIHRSAWSASHSS